MNIERPTLNIDNNCSIKSSDATASSFVGWVKTTRQYVGFRPSTQPTNGTQFNICLRSGSKPNKKKTGSGLHSRALNDYFCFFIFSHSTFDVGRSMFDVRFFQFFPHKNKLALMGLAPKFHSAALLSLFQSTLPYWRHRPD